MTTEQLAEQYAEEHHELSDGFSGSIMGNRYLLEQAYLAGAKDRWVKVEDGLPEIYTEVLGWWFQKECPVVCVHEKDGIFKSSWDMTEIIITHWQTVTPPQD